MTPTTHANLCKHFKLDGIVGLDWETYYDNDYSLKKMATTEYVIDSRFATQCVSVRWNHETKPMVLSPAQFSRWVKTVNWKRNGMLAHHTQFDGLILSHHYGVVPAMYFDTMSMSRPIMPLQVGASLKALTEAFGRKGKAKAQALVDVKGKRELTKAEYKALAAYAGDDIDDAWFIFGKLLPFLPVEELRIIDATVRMFAQPVLKVDGAAMLAVSEGETARKAALLKALKVTRTQLGSNASFMPMLEALGVEIPTKLSPAKKKALEAANEAAVPEDFIPALAASDLAFKSLLAHENKRVRQLVEARFAIKSVNLERKSALLASRAHLPALPVYLSYAKARTYRWTGGDDSNLQALDRGSGMRKALHAPPGYKLLIVDLAQIEARMTAWYAGQNDVVEAFRNKQDVYKQTAANVYHKSADLITTKERFVGKTGVLGCGYGAGAPRFAGMLRIGQFGPAVDISDEDAKAFVYGWRAANYMIVNDWKSTMSVMTAAFLGKTRIAHKHGVVYEGVGTTGFCHHEPTGLSMRYDGIAVDEQNQLTYVSEVRRNRFGEMTLTRKKLYGGLAVENRTQFMARQVLAHQMMQIVQLPKVRLALTTHDEMVLVVPESIAEKTMAVVEKIMTTSPAWAVDLPLAVDAHISEVYDK